VLVLVVDGYEEEHEKRQHANGHGGRQRFRPKRQVDARRLGVCVMAVVVVMVTVARAQFRQTQEYGHEQQRPANVPDIFLGQLHDGGESTDNRVFSWRKTKQ